MDVKEFLEEQEKPYDKIILGFIVLLSLFVISKAFFSGTESTSVELVRAPSSTQNLSDVQNQATVITEAKPVVAAEKKTLEQFAATNPEPLNQSDNELGWSLGLSEEVFGTPVLMVPLVSDSDAQADHVDDPKPAKNILFMNTQSNESSWMFDEGDRLLLNISQFPDVYNFTAENNQTQAIFYDAITQDTNGDGEINYADRASLAISDAQGKSYRVILNEYDSIISKTLTEDNNVFMVYQNDGIAYSMLYRLSPFGVLSTRELPKIAKRSTGPRCPDVLESNGDAVDCAIYHGGNVSDLSADKNSLITERSGNYWVVRQDPDDQAESHWEFVLSEGGKLMSMKEIAH